MTQTATALSSNPAPAAGRLDRRRGLALIVYGAVAWALAAGLVRLIAPLGLLRGAWSFASFAAAIPLLWASIAPARRFLRPPPGQLAAAVALATTTALLLDGVAMMWFPGLYGPDPAAVLPGAAFIFWGAGVGQTLAFLLERR